MRRTPLTPLQTNVLIASLRAPESGSYVLQNILDLTGEVDADALKQAWSRLIARHAVLRTSMEGTREGDQLYNAAAVFDRGRVSGLYRKLHTAIRRSVYSQGSATPVFQVGELTFGIVICCDSTFSEPAKAMAAQGAAAVFIPTNNGLPNNRAYAELV